VTDDVPLDPRVDPAVLALVGSIRTPAAVIDRTGVTRWVNASFTRHYGASPVGRGLHDALASVGQEPSTLPRFAAALAEHRAHAGDVLVRTAGGQRRWQHLNAEPIDASAYFLVLMSDAEPRMRALAEAERGQAALRAVVALAESALRVAVWQDALLTALRDLGIATRALSAVGYRFYGVDAVEQGFWSYRPGLPPTPRIDGLGWLAELLTGDVLVFDELPRTGGRPQMPRADGIFALVPVMLDGRCRGFMAFERAPEAPPWSQVDRLAFRAAAQTLATAIERERRDRTVQEERTFAQQVLQGVLDGVIVVDAHRRVEFANEAAHEMLTVELIGRPIADFALPIDAESDARPDAAGHELTLERADGAITLLVREARRPFGPRGARRIVVMTDITELKRFERRLASAVTRAEAASAAKTRFLGRVSHELRTPLQVVTGYAQLVAIEAGEGATVTAFAHEIHAAGQHLDRVVQDLLDLSGAELDELAVEFDVVDLLDQTRRALQQVAPVLEAAGVAVRLHATRSVRVVGDGKRVAQVILNLLSNAVKYGPADRPLSIDVGIDPTRTRGRWEIRDEGPGFPADEIDRLFVPFERLSNARGKAGTGLGLALSRVLMERMGGRLEAANAEDGGARVWFELPLHLDPST
jgi:signal transduction histidine kinase